MSEFAYRSLVKEVLTEGVKKKTRNGNTLSIFGHSFTTMMDHAPFIGFPVLTSKEIIWNSVVTELLWFMRGETNIKYLLDNNCNIWNGDAYKQYCDNTSTPLSKKDFIQKIKQDEKFCEKHGELGPIYGAQWRGKNPFTKEQGVDQLCQAVEMLEHDPDSRRIIVNAWNPADIPSMALPPCHYSFQFYTEDMSLYDRRRYYVDKTKDDSVPKIKKKMSSNYIENLKLDLDERNAPSKWIKLLWNQRSVDVFLGLPFNISSYALLLTIIADHVNMAPHSIKGFLGDVHLYENHISQANELLKRKSHRRPDLVKTDEYKELINKKMSFFKKIDLLKPDMFQLNNYIHSGRLHAPLNN